MLYKSPEGYTMFNPKRLLGAIISAAVFTAVAATPALAADLTQVPNTNISVGQPVVNGCDVTIAGEASTEVYNAFDTYVAARVGGLATEDLTRLATTNTANAVIPFTLKVTVPSSGTYGTTEANKIDIFWSYGPDGTEFHDLGTIEVTNCTPVVPTLDAVSTGDCTFDVLYTGERPNLSVSVKGKKVLQVIASTDPEPGVISYIIDVAGAPAKGKNANTVTVYVDASNGTSDTVKVVCT